MQEIHKLSEIMNARIGHSVMGEDCLQKLLHRLLSVKADDFVLGRGIRD